MGLISDWDFGEDEEKLGEYDILEIKRSMVRSMMVGNVVRI